MFFSPMILQLVTLRKQVYKPHPFQDKFVKRCRSITEKITEETTEIEGEWLTEEDMGLLKFSELLCGMKSTYIGVIQPWYDIAPTIIMYGTLHIIQIQILLYLFGKQQFVESLVMRHQPSRPNQGRKFKG